MKTPESLSMKQKTMTIAAALGTLVAVPAGMTVANGDFYPTIANCLANDGTSLANVQHNIEQSGASVVTKIEGQRAIIYDISTSLCTWAGGFPISK